MQKWPANAVTAFDTIKVATVKPVAGTGEDLTVGWIYNTNDSMFYASNDVAF
jgi:hypothetical protein